MFIVQSSQSIAGAPHCLLSPKGQKFPQPQIHLQFSGIKSMPCLYKWASQIKEVSNVWGQSKMKPSEGSDTFNHACYGLNVHLLLNPNPL